MGIIIKPLVTEKMTAITDKTNNRFGFIVRPEANKLEIKKEVEALYNVTVVDVNTMKYAGKTRAAILVPVSSTDVRMRSRRLSLR